MIGYTYDYGLQELANYNAGSHELFLRFELGSGACHDSLHLDFFNIKKPK